MADQAIADEPLRLRSADEERAWVAFAAASLAGMIACPGDVLGDDELEDEVAAQDADALVRQLRKRTGEEP